MVKSHTLVFDTKDKINYQAIIDGVKLIETRAATKTYLSIAPGDILTIVCGSQKIVRVVKKIEYFKSIEELVELVELKAVMPYCNTIQEAQAIWYSFPGYKKKISQYGLLAFYL